MVCRRVHAKTHQTPPHFLADSITSPRQPVSNRSHSIWHLTSCSWWPCAVYPSNAGETGSVGPDFFTEDIGCQQRVPRARVRNQPANSTGLTRAGTG
ncbi:RagB/SusD family protein [Anopheles sinensis]|uniref:RagB/SusD family protein n=1 Tax=Anopheles sinensis TaxID=74873 RepID=A0A084WT02_ANOSI|nr:RagB/SusD family protein [Anopheles sinensis]